MKPSIVIALVVVGGAIILTPVICDYLLTAKHQDNVARILEGDVRSVTLQKGELGKSLVTVSWVSGISMVAVAVVLAFRLPNQPGRDDGGT